MHLNIVNLKTGLESIKHRNINTVFDVVYPSKWPTFSQICEGTRQRWFLFSKIL